VELFECPGDAKTSLAHTFFWSDDGVGDAWSRVTRNGGVFQEQGEEPWRFVLNLENAQQNMFQVIGVGLNFSSNPIHSKLFKTTSTSGSVKTTIVGFNEGSGNPTGVTLAKNVMNACSSKDAPLPPKWVQKGGIMTWDGIGIEQDLSTKRIVGDACKIKAASGAIAIGPEDSRVYFHEAQNQTIGVLKLSINGEICEEIGLELRASERCGSRIFTDASSRNEQIEKAKWMVKTNGNKASLYRSLYSVGTNNLSLENGDEVSREGLPSIALGEPISCR
jgi:hypothetical protein